MHSETGFVLSAVTLCPTSYLDLKGRHPDNALPGEEAVAQRANN